MPRSADNAKSGKKGYRPHGHAKDNVPTKVTAKYGEVGWTLLGDAEDWFYMKFVEWGTSKQPPQDFIYSVMAESDADYSRIADAEYQRLLNEKLGG
jgi:HK97 gp10 family phage protein